jgi:AcrR family transcriptional regulator
VNKKTAIIKTATQLFSSQGYEATTTLQIARKVGITEPAVFYHYKNKNELFSAVLNDAINCYLSQLSALDIAECEAIECLKGLIGIHFSIITEEPERMRLLLRTCPARLKDPEDTCSKAYSKARTLLKETVVGILNKGVNSGSFAPLEIDATANMLIALLNGLMRQQVAAMDKLAGVEAATIEFCKNALFKKDLMEISGQFDPS